MDDIDIANRAAYRELQAIIKQNREKAKYEKIHPKGSCHNCGTKIKKKATNQLFCDEDCRDDYTYIQERKQINK